MKARAYCSPVGVGADHVERAACLVVLAHSKCDERGQVAREVVAAPWCQLPLLALRQLDEADSLQTPACLSCTRKSLLHLCECQSMGKG